MVSLITIVKPSSYTKKLYLLLLVLIDKLLSAPKITTFWEKSLQ